MPVVARAREEFEKFCDSRGSICCQLDVAADAPGTAAAAAAAAAAASCR